MRYYWKFRRYISHNVIFTLIIYLNYFIKSLVGGKYVVTILCNVHHKQRLINAFRR